MGSPGAPNLSPLFPSATAPLPHRRLIITKRLCCRPPPACVPAGFSPAALNMLNICFSKRSSSSSPLGPCMPTSAVKQTCHVDNQAAFNRLKPAEQLLIVFYFVSLLLSLAEVCLEPCYGYSI